DGERSGGFALDLVREGQSRKQAPVRRLAPARRYFKGSESRVARADMPRVRRRAAQESRGLRARTGSRHARASAAPLFQGGTGRRPGYAVGSAATSSSMVVSGSPLDT